MIKFVRQYRKRTVIFLLTGSLLVACSDDDNNNNGSDPELNSINSVIKAGEILTSVEKNDTEVNFVFEKTKIVLPVSQVQDVKMNKDNWKTNVVFANGETLEIPTLGEHLLVDSKKLELNPTGYSPLTAKLSYLSPVDGYIELKIESKKKEVPTITHLTTEYGKKHDLKIYGLYPDHENKVYISLTDKEGKTRAIDSIVVKTDPLKIKIPEITVLKSDVPKMEEGLTLVSYVGDHQLDAIRPFMMDAMGDVRWCLELKGHTELKKLAAGTGLKRMQNGNFLGASLLEDGGIYEIDMFGELIKKWDIESKGYSFHHDLVEIDNGNFLIAVTKHSSKNSDGNPVGLDYMIELDRASGNIVKEWDFKLSMDEHRNNYNNRYSRRDWAHHNAITFDPKDRSIIVSNRFQGVTKLDWDNKTQWMLSPHKGFAQNGRGEAMSNYLLKPLDKSGKLIADQKIIDGELANDEFDWIWSPHCPVLVGDNRILIFDNGYYRHYKENDDQSSYSRAVEYRIDENNKTIQQTWEFGKELKQEGYSSIVSSVQYLENKDHVLFGSGAISFGVSEGSRSGRIIEIDYKTKEIVQDVKIGSNASYVFHRATRMPLYP